MNRNVRRGDVVWIRFDPTVGCEIQKCRPAIVVSADALNGNATNAILIVIPLTSLQEGQQVRPDEVIVVPGGSGLTRASVTVIDQIRAIDRQRIVRVAGSVPASLMANIDRCIHRVLALV